ncbi:hypothetical protein GYMLUDRAFT_245651 [Collybiopsis luxurians FD-317 M1]|uniref:Cytochrome P450 n=1 Tax=Collybiopsis luxurians FD-317 M1 TaxID=944289 RepID=A0A0D0C8Q2_9AGAR|nr:hypothetical protein GYMLUDRAFT_245651 [Collybiopsis luxurians FD-317 M1]
MAELLGRHNNVGFTYYGPRLKKLRRILHKSLNPVVLSKSWAYLLKQQSTELCWALSENPDNGYHVVELVVQELITSFTYGRKPDEEYLALSRIISERTGEALQPGRWTVNFIPALKWVPSWLPGAGFQKWAQDARRIFYRIVREPFQECKLKMKAGVAEQSFVQQSLSELASDAGHREEEVVMFAAGSLFSAGTETLSAVLLSFIALMARNPDVQLKAFNEISTHVGLERLPTIEDRRFLTFIDCIIQEVHRMHPAVCLVPHSNTEDQIYNGYHIPKKSWVMANVWAMLHDNAEYPQSDEFSPSRFEGTSPSADPRIMTYGFGRR